MIVPLVNGIILLLEWLVMLAALKDVPVELFVQHVILRVVLVPQVKLVLKNVYLVDAVQSR